MPRASKASPTAQDAKEAVHMWWRAHASPHNLAGISAAPPVATTKTTAPSSRCQSLGLCECCTSAHLTTTSVLTPDDVATPEALAAWREAHASVAHAVEGACIPSLSTHAGRAQQQCALWTRVLAPEELAHFAASNARCLQMSVPQFGPALQTYLSQRLLCKPCRGAVLSAWRSIEEVHRGPCGCTPDFCTSIADPDVQWWPHAVVSLTHSGQGGGGRLTGRWDGDAFSSPQSVFSWSMGTSRLATDVHPWTETDDGGAACSIDTQIDTLPLAETVASANLHLHGDALPADVYVNVRVALPDGSVDVISQRAHAMGGEECAHLAFLFDDAAGTVSLTTGPDEADMQDFFVHAERLQLEDAAEADAEHSPAGIRDYPDASVNSESVPPVVEDAHVDTPELAAEALLDAACVILKQHAEEAYRRAASRDHVSRLQAALVADQAEHAISQAYRAVQAEAQAARLLAELELEGTRASAATSAKKAKKKQKPQHAASPPEDSIESETALPPQSPSSRPVMVTQEPPPASPVTPIVTPAASPEPDAAEQWNVQSSRRRRRLSSNGSRDSLASAGEEGLISGHALSRGVSPTGLDDGRAQQPHGTVPSHREASLCPHSALPQHRQRQHLPPPPPPPPSAMGTMAWPALQAAAPLAPMRHAPSPAQAQARPLPPPALRMSAPSAAAAFYEGSTAFGMFQLPIGGGSGQSGSPSSLF